MRFGKLAPLLSRVGTLLLLSLLLALSSRAVASGHRPGLSLWLYGARLACWTTLTIALPSLLLFGVERTLPRGRVLATLLLLALEVPFFRPIAAFVASGDGLRARGISAVLVEWVALGLLLALSAAVWTYRYWARGRVLDLGLGVVFGALVLACAALLSRAQVQLAAVLQIHVLVLGVSVLHAGEASWPRPLALLAALGVAGTAILLIAGLIAPGEVTLGRRQALLTESAISLLAGRLLPDRSEPPLPARTPERCAQASQPPEIPPWSQSEERRRNVILISIDSVRADYVRRPRPDGTPLMPELLRFMRESRSATRAHAAFPATLLSLSAAFTGVLPTDLLLSGAPYPTLMQQTRGAFDLVMAVLPSGDYFERPDVQAFLLPDVEAHEMGGARRTNRYALGRMRDARARGRRHLIWVHYFEPHAPYQKHDEFDFGDSEEQRYRSELAYADQQLGELLQVLRDEGWYDDSLIAVFADHGESFGEHEHYHHHYLVYPWLVSVPFALHAPGLAPGVFAGPVQLMDLAPTVLQFVGLQAQRPLRGVPLLAADPPADRALFSEEIAITGRHLLPYRTQLAASEDEVFARLRRVEHGGGYASKLAIAQRDLMLVQHRSSRAVELYDMWRDPLAAHDLTEARPDDVRRLSDALFELRGQTLLRSLCDVH